MTNPSAPERSADQPNNVPDLTEATIWAILNNDLDDHEVNRLVWTHLGYSYHPDTDQWTAEGVTEPWREKYPTPPDFIASRPATVQLTRSIPKANKQLLKTHLGFKGYSVDQLIPRLTRRATMANWLLSVMKEQDLLSPKSSS